MKTLVAFMAGVILALVAVIATTPTPTSRIVAAGSVGPTFSSDDLSFIAKLKLYRASDGIKTVTIRLTATPTPDSPCEPFDLTTETLTADSAGKLSRAGFTLDSVSINK